MSDESAAAQVKRGNDYGTFRQQITDAGRVQNGVKSNITTQRALLVTEFGAGSAEVSEIDALMTALRAQVVAFAASY